VLWQRIPKNAWVGEQNCPGQGPQSREAIQGEAIMFRKEADKLSLGCA